MCYSAEASIISLSIELVVSIVLFTICDWSFIPKGWKDVLNKDDNRVVGTIVFGVGTMQYAELLMHLDDFCNNGNNLTGSKLAILSLIAIQPAFGYIAITEFGYRRDTDVGTVLKIVWVASFLTYMILISTNALNDLCGTHESDVLNGTVSNLCTVDHSCDGDLCDLVWHFDDVNQRPRYWFYMLCSMLLPACALKGWALWVILLLTHSIWSLIANPSEPNDIISGAAVTCYWLPLLTGFFQLTGLPIWIQSMCQSPDHSRKTRNL